MRRPAASAADRRILSNSLGYDGIIPRRNRLRYGACSLHRHTDWRNHHARPRALGKLVRMATGCSCSGHRDAHSRLVSPASSRAIAQAVLERRSTLSRCDLSVGPGRHTAPASVSHSSFRSGSDHPCTVWRHRHFSCAAARQLRSRSTIADSGWDRPRFEIVRQFQTT